MRRTKLIRPGVPVMDSTEIWAIGADLGGTKIQVGQVDAKGELHRKIHRATQANRGPAAVKADLIAAIQAMRSETSSLPVGVGVGVAGQIDSLHGAVRFSPNLGWHDEPFQENLQKALGLPVVVTNDVRAATWGEWLHGAGQGCMDLICLFVGTGIGGGVVSNGQILAGSGNSGGELGHITTDLNGPLCRCGNRGCLEALAGGWAIARRAQELIAANPESGTSILEIAEGKLEAVTAKTVAQASQKGDPLAMRIIGEVEKALIAGAVSLVNAFNPCRLILGGGVIEGLPELVGRIAQGVRRQALKAATELLQTMPSQLHNDAGVVGAAVLAMRSFKKT
jgi:glucokinase